MSVLGNSQLLMTPEGYQISRSVRLRSSASAYFNRTPATTTNQTTVTFSMWVKRGTLGVEQIFYTGRTSTNFPAFDFRFTSGDLLWVAQYTTGAAVQFQLITSQVFRDPSAWYHIVVAFDTTQATSTNRIKIYINGVQVTAFGTATYPSQNLAVNVNTTNVQYIGAGPANSSYFDGYMTEVNFIDGQALTPSSFGENDTVTGVWKPKKYTGTYGTNGFYLNFSDNSNNTAATIGKDYSGNGNNWTPNNISVTSGATYDSMTDVPTLNSPTAANYCTGNPLNSDTDGPLSDGNLNWRVDNTRTVTGTIAVSSGKFYWEHTVTNITSDIRFGIVSSSRYLRNVFVNPSSYADGYSYISSGNKQNNNSSSAYGASFTVGDVIGVAFDADSGTLTFYKNGTSQGSAFTGISGSFVAFSYGTGAGPGGSSANFGQRPFSYTPPTGFKALNTQNLPDATIKKGNQYFDATLYTGTGATLNVNNAAGFAPDLVWIKSRSGAVSHGLHDRVRGEPYAWLGSDSTSSESTGGSYVSSYGGLTSTGFQVNSNTSGNGNGSTFVGWQWKESASAGFDIVTYTGTGSATTVNHSLGVAPKMMIVKQRDSGSNSWFVYHASTGAGNWLALNLTNAITANTSIWNNTAPTSSVFSVGASTATNASAGSYLAYLFSEVAGFSKFGSYTGNGSTNGPFVYCGFRPRWVMWKRTDVSDNWNILDTSRNSYNLSNSPLYPNLSNAEGTGNNIDILSNGFKVRDSGTPLNASGGTYIFAAFAENPFKNSLAR